MTVVILILTLVSNFLGTTVCQVHKCYDCKGFTNCHYSVKVATCGPLHENYSCVWSDRLEFHEEHRGCILTSFKEKYCEMVRSVKGRCSHCVSDLCNEPEASGNGLDLHVIHGMVRGKVPGLAPGLDIRSNKLAPCYWCGVKCGSVLKVDNCDDIKKKSSYNCKPGFSTTDKNGKLNCRISNRTGAIVYIQGKNDSCDTILDGQRSMCTVCYYSKCPKSLSRMITPSLIFTAAAIFTQCFASKFYTRLQYIAVSYGTSSL